jgi:nitrite reductase/ring-hydroxylating ferredoxin subunit
MPPICVAKLADLRRDKTAKFTFRREGIKRDGFAVMFAGEVAVFENTCRHIPISIDYGDNQFFTPDGQHIICRTHGAVYEPLSGLCVRGPCEGAKLAPIQFELRGEEIWINDDP